MFFSGVLKKAFFLKPVLESCIVRKRFVLLCLLITAGKRITLVFGNRELLFHEEILSWQRKLGSLASRTRLPAKRYLQAEFSLSSRKFFSIKIAFRAIWARFEKFCRIMVTMIVCCAQKFIAVRKKEIFDKALFIEKNLRRPDR